MVIETIPGVASGKGEGNESKRLAVMFCGGGDGNVLILIGVVDTSGYVFAKIHQTVYFKRVYFIVCRLYLNIVTLK